ncbi:EFR1 family ferrodoxin [candidate division WOR-3 bacterium]|nr:EFR1 family ferrodoxin [candidate division WOR-3 bacterium]
MQRALILFFTGTGNTWFLADSITKELRKRGFKADMIALERSGGLDPDTFELLGIGFPVYSGCFPYNIWRFVRDLKNVHGKPAFVFSTKAQATPGSEALLARLLARKGYRVLSARSFIAPSNETLLLGPEDISKPEVLKKLERVKNEVPGFVEDMFAGNGVIEKDNTFMLLSSLVSGLAFYLNTGYLTNLKVTDKCSRCGLCEEICPAGNIGSSLTRPRFRNRCLVCERCVNFCPQRSIVHPVTFVRTSIRYRAPGYRPPLLRKATR